mgnify:FL=1
MPIDCASQPRKQLRANLGFVQNDELSAFNQCVPLQVQSKAVHLLLQIVVNPSQGSGQRCLAGLAGADEGYGRVLLQTALQNR